MAEADPEELMKRTLILSATICALLTSAVFAFGDIARPKPTPAQGKTVLYTGLTVVPDPKATEARLQISQNTLKSIQEAMANSGGTESMTQSIMHSSTRTIMAGLFMFLAVSFGGASGNLEMNGRGAMRLGALLSRSKLSNSGTPPP